MKKKQQLEDSKDRGIEINYVLTDIAIQGFSADFFKKDSIETIDGSEPREEVTIKAAVRYLLLLIELYSLISERLTKLSNITKLADTYEQHGRSFSEELAIKNISYEKMQQEEKDTENIIAPYRSKRKVFKIIAAISTAIALLFMFVGMWFFADFAYSHGMTLTEITITVIIISAFFISISLIFNITAHVIKKRMSKIYLAGYSEHQKFDNLLTTTNDELYKILYNESLSQLRLIDYIAINEGAKEIRAKNAAK